MTDLGLWGHNPKSYKTLSAETDVRQEAPLSPTSFERRFWSRVDKNGPVNARRPELGPCWIWTGSRYTDPRDGAPSYGQTMHAGKRTSAHRASFLHHGGTIPDGHDVMHLCDTKPCVRPDHLKAGTRTENLLDGFASPANFGVCSGENNGRAVLNWDKVHAIRAAVAAGATHVSQADKYGCSQPNVSAIIAGRKWPESKCPIHGTMAESVA